MSCPEGRRDSSTKYEAANRPEESAYTPSFLVHVFPRCAHPRRPRQEEAALYSRIRWVLVVLFNTGPPPFAAKVQLIRLGLCNA